MPLSRHLRLHWDRRLLARWQRPSWGWGPRQHPPAIHTGQRCGQGKPPARGDESCASDDGGLEGDAERTLRAGSRLCWEFLPAPAAGEGAGLFTLGTGGSAIGLPEWRLNLGDSSSCLKCTWCSRGRGSGNLPQPRKSAVSCALSHSGPFAVAATPAVCQDSPF